MGHGAGGGRPGISPVQTVRLVESTPTPGAGPQLILTRVSFEGNIHLRICLHKMWALPSLEDGAFGRPFVTPAPAGTGVNEPPRAARQAASSSAGKFLSQLPHGEERTIHRVPAS